MNDRVLGIALALALLIHLPAPVGAQQRYSHDRWIADGYRIEVETRGEVEYSDDSRAIESIAEGGSFALEEERPGSAVRRVELRGVGGGRIERSYRVGGAPATFDAAAESWFRELLREVIRRRSSSSASRSSSSTASETVEPPDPPTPPTSER